MKKHLILVPTTQMSNEQWLAHRKRGIGASEVGTVMGLNPYKASIQLFYEKIGEDLGYSIENMATFMGKEQEPTIAKLWQYWEGDQESIIRNAKEGRIVRKCQRVNAYVHNPKYPWLFCSLDRKAIKTDTTDEGAIELKTIEGWEAEKWENEIPPSHVVQVQTQLLVCEFTWGELATLKNGRWFDCLPFTTHTEIQESILRMTEEFWNRVEKARAILTQKFEAERNFNQALADHLAAELQKLEPEPDGSDAFNNFLKEKYKIALPGERPGTPQQLAWAKGHKQGKDEIKALQEQIQFNENNLKNDIRDGCDMLDFGANGYVSWKANKNGTRVFLNKTK